MTPRNSDEVRAEFLSFFAERGHSVVPSASLIPHDPSVLFTVAGMVPFKPYFVGDEIAPWARAASVQRCVRAGGKHNDLDDIGRTNRHFSFFEMLGNFSFGDYFKREAIIWAWELVTEGFGLDRERLWVTVHTSDDEAANIWRNEVGLDADRIHRLGDDNFWRMADTGPCGPSSEIFWDLGDEFGAGGGPGVGSDDRFVEIWNLVFMEFDQRSDGQVALPKPSIDTGAGLERLLMALQGVNSIFDIDVFQPLVRAAETASGVAYGNSIQSDISLRILAEHSRAMTFLISDGVVPSNEDRGYVLRRIIRRAVRHAYLLGSRGPVTPELVRATVGVMGSAYPEIVEKSDFIIQSVEREEDRFRQTLERGVDMLEDLSAKGDISGADAFFMHDTLGFPIDLTREIAGEQKRNVDLDGFANLMAEQRERGVESRNANKSRISAPLDLYRSLLESNGPTDFIGRRSDSADEALVQALIVDGISVDSCASGDVDIVLNQTPFYAEAGGQVGDAGRIASPSGLAGLVVDTTYGIPGLIVHHGELTSGKVSVGDTLTATIDSSRRDRIRRNHTATHILHWALREVLGSDVHQAGSLVAPERLRFDFNYHEALSVDQLNRIEEMANLEVIGDARVRHYETTKEEAETLGALAFFGDKYGDIVRVLEAGDKSIELCGGTHVHALGFIGPIKIVSEGSIGANLRRIEAVTGVDALSFISSEERVLQDIASSLKVAPSDLGDRVARLVDEVKELRREVSKSQASIALIEANELAALAQDQFLVLRRDGLANDDLRRLAVATLAAMESGIVGLIGLTPDGTKGAIAVAISPDLIAKGVSAYELANESAQILGGGTGRQADVAVGGGPQVDGIDAAVTSLLKAVTTAKGK